MSLRPWIFRGTLIAIAALAWAWISAVDECDQRSSLKTLTIGMERLLREGSALRVVDRAAFARALSRQGVICRPASDIKTDMPGLGGIRCWEERTCGIKVPFIRFTDFHFNGDDIVQITEDRTKRAMEGPDAK